MMHRPKSHRDIIIAARVCTYAPPPVAIRIGYQGEQDRNENAFIRKEPDLSYSSVVVNWLLNTEAEGIQHHVIINGYLLRRGTYFKATWWSILLRICSTTQSVINYVQLFRSTVDAILDLREY